MLYKTVDVWYKASYFEMLADIIPSKLFFIRVLLNKFS